MPPLVFDIILETRGKNKARIRGLSSRLRVIDTFSGQGTNADMLGVLKGAHVQTLCHNDVLSTSELSRDQTCTGSKL